VYLVDTGYNQGTNVTDTVAYNLAQGTISVNGSTDSTDLPYYSNNFTVSIDVSPGTLTWSLTDNQSWISISGASGVGDDSSVTISLTTNPDTTPRFGALTLSSGGTTLDNLIIFQNDNPCVAPNTKITMSDGTYKRAGDLKVGDEVKTKHETTLETVNARVTQMRIAQSERVKAIIGDKEIICTPNHRFYVDNKSKFIAIKDIEVGDILTGKEFISLEEYTSGDVVKLTVENAATYLSEDILSHNIK
jgi:hypothetical protein